MTQDAWGATVEQHRSLLAQTRGEKPILPENTQAIADAIIGFVQTPDWDSAQVWVEERTDLLLQPETDLVFGAIIAGQTDANTVQTLGTYRTVLMWCREYGIAAAIARVKAF